MLLAVITFIGVIFWFMKLTEVGPVGCYYHRDEYYCPGDCLLGDLVRYMA